MFSLTSSFKVHGLGRKILLKVVGGTLGMSFSSFLTCDAAHLSSVVKAQPPLYGCYWYNQEEIKSKLPIAPEKSHLTAGQRTRPSR